MKKMLLVLAVLSILGLVACSQTLEQSSATDAPDTAAVELKDFAFTPDTVTIKRGGSVTWTNKDSALHTVTSDEFDSGDLKKGGSFTQTFAKTGNYNVKCTYHPSMTMRVIVK